MGEIQNPYAPPVETSDPLVPGPKGGALTLSEKGWETVTSLAKWMRIVATFFYICGGLLAAVAVISLITGSSMMDKASSLQQGGILAGSAGVMLIVVVLLFLSGAWLRSAAFHFYDGVLSDAESALAQGFRKLRLFLILYGIYALLGLAENIYQLVAS